MNHQTQMRPRLLTRDEACTCLNVSLSFLKLLIGRGTLREVRLGRRSLIAESEIDRLIAESIANAGVTDGAHRIASDG